MKNIKVGQKILFKYDYRYRYDQLVEVTVTKIAGSRFQIHRWWPFSQWWHHWFKMESCELVGEVTEKVERGQGN